MGATGQQAAMAAGLAGGLGLCGAACGALGAAVWMTSLKHHQATGKPMDFKAPQGLAVIARFEQATGGVFQCSKIAGRCFSAVEDHAQYLSQGGCTKVMAALAG